MKPTDENIYTFSGLFIKCVCVIYFFSPFISIDILLLYTCMMSVALHFDTNSFSLMILNVCPFQYARSEGDTPT